MTKYRTIVADPPWDHSDGTGLSYASGKRVESAGLPYSTMTAEEIAALPVRRLSIPDTRPAREGSTLFLWTTSAYLCAAHSVAEAWGFHPSAVLVWCKEPRGFTVGGTFASNVEFVIYARRGAPKLLDGATTNTRWFRWPRGRHSEKPAAFYDLVEQVSPGPYLELFARRQRLGWDTWGDEALGHVEMAS